MEGPESRAAVVEDAIEDQAHAGGECSSATRSGQGAVAPQQRVHLEYSKRVDSGGWRLRRRPDWNRRQVGAKFLKIVERLDHAVEESPP